MENVLRVASALNAALLASAEYKEFKSASKELDRHPEYRDLVDKFRKRQMAYEVAKINGEACEDEFALSNDYADICLITVCNDFFQAELQFLALFKSAMDAVCSGIEIDM